MNKLLIICIISIFVIIKNCDSSSKKFIDNDDDSWSLRSSSEENELQKIDQQDHTIIDFKPISSANYVLSTEMLEQHSSVRGIVNYSIGSRLSGDSLVGLASKNQSWPRMQNVKVTLTYPTSGIGRQITYVHIQVAQTSNLGQAYITKGGLHQRYIQIVVESYNTFSLNYTAQFFGV